MKHVGCYFPDHRYRLAQTIGNFVIESPQALFHPTPARAEALAQTDLRLMLQFHIGTQDQLLNTSGRFTQELSEARDALAGAGLLDRVIAVMPSEEWYSRTKAGALNDWPDVRAIRHAADKTRVLASALCQALNRLVPIIKAVFPSALVGHVEPFWHDDPMDPALYHPVPPAYDFLGVDAYVDGVITRAKFNRIVDRAYAHASTYGKPILMVPQAFADHVEPWRYLPTPTQFGWWAELPERYPLIQGCAYFCLDHPHATATGLTRAPAQLAQAQAYWRER